MKKKFLLLLLFSLAISSCNLSLTKTETSTPATNIAAQTTLLAPTQTQTPTPQARVSLAQQSVLDGDFDTALQQFEAALNASDPEVVAEAMLGIGKIYYQRQDYETAVQKLGWLVNSVSGGDSRTQGFFYLAKSYEDINEYALAADAYKNYLELTPSTPLKGDILEMEGDDLLAADNAAGALAIYQQALPLSRPEYLEELRVKIARATSASGDDNTAINLFLDIYSSSSNGYTKASINLFLGQLYLKAGLTDQAYARFQDSVKEFPTAYDTYSGLVFLVEAGQTVDDLQRGIVDYYAGQYGMAISALDRYIYASPNPVAEAHYYRALSLYRKGDYEGEVSEWDKLIQEYPGDPDYYAKAFLEKSTTQWQKLGQYGTAAQTLLTFVATEPTAPEAANYLFTAARLFEQNNQLEYAAKTWQRVIDEYPSDDNAILAQFEEGICYYRLGQYVQAQVVFQRNSLLASAVEDKARAELWVGKSLQKQNKKDEANTAFQQAAATDPTGYYSIRAKQILNGQSPFPTGDTIDLGVALDKERSDADAWMRDKFKIATDIDLTGAGDLASNILYQRGDAFWNLGLTSKAQAEFESLRLQLVSDALNSYRLMNHMVDLELNQTAILCARQVLDLAAVDLSSLTNIVPVYFTHIRFGAYYRSVVVPAAVDNKIDPLLLFSLIRQESLFEADIVSSQGASGLMQIIPSVADEIVTDYGWPNNFITQDLTRPLVNIKLGAFYLTKWLNYFDGDMTAALAAYNGGIGNAIEWKSLAGDDSDLFLEVVRYDETRNYVRYIAENYETYKSTYTHP